nr:molecular chaperone DnaJ [Mycobacterium sp. UM_NZ2]
MSLYPHGMILRPLTGWPHDFTTERTRGRFDSSLTETLTLLDRELRMLAPHCGHGYPDSVLQLALREQDFRRTDGMPRAGAVTEHPGVILNIEPRNRPPLSFPCDTFTHWHANLRAIALTLEALRKIDRYGVTQTGQQYRGWQAIEAKPASYDSVTMACQALARIAWPNEHPGSQAAWAPKIATSPETGRSTYRQARRNAHPDRNGGDQALWDQVESAAAVLRNAGCAL